MRTAIAGEVDLAVDYDLCHLIYNSQPHIDECVTGVDEIVPNEEREAGVYYALLHKHYDLKSGEIIVAEFDGHTHKTRVEQLTRQNRGYEPCMWYSYKGRYYAVMFSASELKAEVTPPQKYREDSGLMHPDYAYAWTEFTSAEERAQSFLLDYRDETATPMVTVVWRMPAVFGGRASACVSHCYKDKDKAAHVVQHQPQHKQTADD
jgi:hypothetical protein